MSKDSLVPFSFSGDLFFPLFSSDLIDEALLLDARYLLLVGNTECYPIYPAIGFHLYG